MRRALDRLSFPREKNSIFLPFCFGKFLIVNWTSTFCMLFKNKNSDISHEKSQKSKRKKGFSTTLKNTETNFWLVWRRERLAISSTKEIVKFYHLNTMGHKLTYHRLKNIKGSSFNFKLSLCHLKKPCQKQDRFNN